ncbi:hypothetical protein [Duganella sp. Root1480D1]|uniref:hypothetical protein n=1 Tax=Duganella sp. Root1480D1 TaxID=1736471 RepID=UPI00070C4F8E|nr:hypothetical protein [Duganella sp. Root1480D1]KQZ34146.1 hypothetical protein ASD58_29100 [Duganella sp. Root1480D1]
MAAEERFLSELAKIHQYWVKTATQVLTDESTDLVAFENDEGIRQLQAAIKLANCQAQVESFIDQISSGIMHSILAGLDGSGSLKEISGVSLVDGDGQPLEAYLHELWPDYYTQR